MVDRETVKNGEGKVTTKNRIYISEEWIPPPSLLGYGVRRHL
ncbi:MAG: hypothetical protein O7B35_19320 [Deltaproteobacteria bacterium]|nr:hypothetical protein [Deltaproteobacteria bacterium]